MKTKGPLKALVVPLDWGLGHATRCIPIIHALKQKGFQVLIAGEGKTKALLQQEFPQLTFLQLEGYRIQYAETKLGLPFKLLAQVPKLLKAIHLEHQWLQTMVQQHQIDVVISDNRYGLYHKAVHTVFITHQLFINTPFAPFSQWLQKQNFKFINRFKECWVPDMEAAPGIAGILSHPKRLPSIPVSYIGLLSRFTATAAKTGNKHILFLLSGPEPQRTLLENKLLQQLPSIQLPALFVRGLPGTTEVMHTVTAAKLVNHLPTAELQVAIEDAELVIARTGYSTVMDLLKLRKKCILIPTPGQTEQEYLGEHLMKNKLAYCISQNSFNLAEAMENAASFPYEQPYLTDASLLEKAVEAMKLKLHGSNYLCTQSEKHN